MKPERLIAVLKAHEGDIRAPAGWPTCQAITKSVHTEVQHETPTTLGAHPDDSVGMDFIAKHKTEFPDCVFILMSRETFQINWFGNHCPHPDLIVPKAHLGSDDGKYAEFGSSFRVRSGLMSGISSRVSKNFLCLIIKIKSGSWSVNISPISMNRRSTGKCRDRSSTLA
jgi:hypothetical protein